MRVSVRLFAVARQKAGRDTVVLDLPEPATVGNLKRALAIECPELAPLVPHLRIAVAAEYASDETAIPPGAEVAAIPPVSGGVDDNGPAFRDGPMIEITEAPIDHAALTERVRSNLAGAVCTFLGTVREMTAGRRTSSLDYEAYPEMALKKMAEIDAEARRRWPVIETAIVHRVGHLELGEVSVVVAVSCPHRHQSFDACRWIIDTLKEIVPIWKKEVWADGGEEWAHPGMNSE